MNATIALKSTESSNAPHIGSHDSKVVPKGLTIPALPKIPSRKFFRQ